MNQSTPRKTRNPWAWVPTLYFGEGLPYVVVMTVAVIMYKRFGLSNTDIALYTSWLYLPWVIKPFWSPFVDILKTKRWWIVTMQLLIGGDSQYILSICHDIRTRPISCISRIPRKKHRKNTIRMESNFFSSCRTLSSTFRISQLYSSPSSC